MPKSPRQRKISQLVRPLLAIGVLLAARASLADQYTVPSGSMEPTVRVSDRIFVNKLAYGLRVPLSEWYLARFAQPARGEVVVLDSPENGIVLLKRVVAVPGDRVRVEGGELEINGQRMPVTARAGQLVEALGLKLHLVALDNGGGPDLELVTIPRDRYLVMGDNRGNSQDGRAFGFVERRAILGRAVGVFWRAGAPTWLSL